MAPRALPVPVAPASGLISDVPGFAPAAPRSAASPIPSSTPGAGAPAPAPAPGAEGDAGPAGPLVVPEEDDGYQIDATRLSTRSRGTPVRLSFDTGEQVDVRGHGLIGRAPVAAPGESVEHVIAIADPGRSVSKTHVAFGHDDGGLWVSDRGSTNGTRVLESGVLLTAVGEERVHVRVGAVVEFGDRLFTVGHR